ncbi:MAG: NifU family protein [Nitrospirota bacterium]|nr:NifU family protein [Nitrospirota bacterium]
MTERVMGVLGRIRPMLNMDGGDVELVEVRNQEVYLRLKGACDGCPSAFFTLRMGIERALRSEIPEIQRVIALP